jgi:hypothetical protein
VRGRSLTATEAVAVLDRVRTLRGLLDRVEAEITSRLDQLHSAGRGAPAADVLTRHQHISSTEAHRRERRAKALAQAASFGAALAAGAVAAEHADVLATVTARVDDQVRSEFFAQEASLLEQATGSSPEQFARHCRDVVTRLERDSGLARNEQQRRETRLTRTISLDGMHHLRGDFHPELGAKIFTAPDHEVAKLVAASDDREADRAQLGAEALGNLVTGGRTDRPGEAEIVVIIDHDTLVDDMHEHTVCETESGAPLPPETVRRLCCGGRIVAVIRAGGVPVNVGRDHRLANRAQRRALRAMYRSCAFPGCEVGFARCEMHHVTPWELGGRTDLANLVPFCSRHHHLVHELGWTLDLAPDRQLTIRTPDGSVYATAPVQIGPTSRDEIALHDLCHRARQRARALRRSTSPAMGSP